MKKYIILILLLIFGLNGNATPTYHYIPDGLDIKKLEAEARSNGLKAFDKFIYSSMLIINNLIDQKIKLENVDLENLLSEIWSTKWFPLTYGFVAGSGRQRSTAVSLVEEKVVIVNVLSLSNFINTDVTPLISLHEALVVNGYDDENYEITLALDQLSKNPKVGRAIFEKYLERLKTKITHNKVYADDRENGGGGTSIGSGGDWTELELKSRILNIAMESFNQSTSDSEILDIEKMIKKIIELKIEANWDTKTQNKNLIKLKHSWIKGMRVRVLSFNWLINTMNTIQNNEKLKNDTAIEVYYFLLKED